jgi:hypothetical protein
MKNYFIQFNCNNPKNKAQEELQKFVIAWDNCLCDEDGLKHIIEVIKKETEDINARNKRCTPISIRHHYYEGLGAELFSAGIDSQDFQVFSTSIEEVKCVVFPFEVHEIVLEEWINGLKTGYADFSKF